ncbi:copper resistance system multicopper oxidase [Trichlorobacter lovleyi]|uniref:copper resistance system multicopper oxidase n=1 Tax=Trichlorobacter lovleyi TaxID=313985 RepID=UPI0023F154C1|nr:copper resistance system multicopper oxidase [Trichlorobacter lovleyi]
MLLTSVPHVPPLEVTRRRFVQGLAAGAMLFWLPSWLGDANGNSGYPPTITGSPPELRGTEFDLQIAETMVNFTGSTRPATTINGSLPAPTLRWRQGDTVTLRVTNRLSVPTSLHWHGIILPYQMDGVPGVSFNGIAPGTTFVYRFKVNQSGTYWYHSHSGMQEQTGMYGALIIDPAERPASRTDRDYVLLLSDWTDEDPMRILAKLKAQSHYYNYNQPTVADFINDLRKQGLAWALDKRQMWNQMRMSPTDLSDVTGATYTYLLNGSPPAAGWTGLFRPGETVRLRCINASAQTFFDLRIPGLKLTVIQVDGQDVEPVSVDELRIGVAETYDLLVTPGQGAYTVFAQAMDRSGFACGTLAERQGLTAAVPGMDQPEWLEMVDMMGAMEHGSHHGSDSAAVADQHHAGHSPPPTAHPLAKPSQTVRHARSEYGPTVDMRVDQPRTNLDDPGIGLRRNGRRVLTYADIRTLGGPLDRRLPEREIELHLTGNMHRYSWSFDGVEYGDSTPIRFRYGERLRIILHNDTMMTHPMHLHGMWSELENADGLFMARRHTISVQPAQRISFLVTADAPGRWVFHCHLLYHMDAGMFREVVVA